jgi:hypothetical protein
MKYYWNSFMFNRPIHKLPISLPKGVALPDAPAVPYENVSHTPGQAAAIRFFDPNSNEDLEAMREILKGKQVRKWMDDASQISQSEYRDWAGTNTKSSYLFAVLDARTSDPEEMKYVRGFVYIYSERVEKFRIRRMEKLGLVEPANGERHMLEASFAVRPLPDGMQQGSGLMSSALRQSCLQVQMLLNSVTQPDVEIFAFTDQENFAAHRTLEASGFVKRGHMKYDWDSPEESLFYMLNWRLLQKKVREKLLEVLQKA